MVNPLMFNRTRKITGVAKQTGPDLALATSYLT